MGTRCITILLDDDGKTEIAVLYRQMDGYPDGHGAELAKFLAGMELVNGFGLPYPEHQANGLNCLAAQIVAHFKQGIGSFYLYPAGTRDAGEEYTYTVYGKEGQEPHLRIQKNVYHDGQPDTLKRLFDGPASKALAWIEKQGEKETEA